MTRTGPMHRGTVRASLVRTGLAAAAGALAARGVNALRETAAQRFPDLVRENHAGAPVSLLEGPAQTAGLLAACVLAPGGRVRAACLLAVGASGALGANDDFHETGSSKGLRGHLSALARGEVTTGALKVIGIPVASVAACALLRRDAQTVLGRACDAVLAGGVVAGTANLMNLFDLRPGRALKAAGVILGLQTAASALPGGTVGTSGAGTGAGGTGTVPAQARSASAVLAGGVLGTAGVLLPDDLAGRSMLGDTGANALGAALGLRSALTASRGRLVCELAVLAALTLASEKVSFTRVIESTPGLRELDALGR
ncbi:hypothetical protein [Brevibacterium album]|uniref:hypothetical protein n=1 Tax=Brevibacterium album TaxID=417948 RepID=UPI00041F92E0|nr:hypothetical protein [Brevibacterium album]